MPKVTHLHKEWYPIKVATANAISRLPTIATFFAVPSVQCNSQRLTRTSQTPVTALHHRAREGSRATEAQSITPCYQLPGEVL